MQMHLFAVLLDLEAFSIPDDQEVAIVGLVSHPFRVAIQRENQVRQILSNNKSRGGAVRRSCQDIRTLHGVYDCAVTEFEIDYILVFWRERFDRASRNGSPIELVISVFRGGQEDDVFGILQPANLRDNRRLFEGCHLRQLDRLGWYLLLFMRQELRNLIALPDPD